MPSSGDVVDLDLGLPRGRAAGFVRPAVVVTAQRILDAAPAVIHVVPLTSRVRRLESEVIIEPEPGNGLTTTSAAQCQHLRAASLRRVSGVRGSVGPVVLAHIRENIAVLLDIPQ